MKLLVGTQTPYSSIFKKLFKCIESCDLCIFYLFQFMKRITTMLLLKFSDLFLWLRILFDSCCRFLQSFMLKMSILQPFLSSSRINSPVTSFTKKSKRIPKSPLSGSEESSSVPWLSLSLSMAETFIISVFTDNTPVTYINFAFEGHN